MFNQEHEERLWLLWGERKQAHPELLRFEDAFIKRAGDDGIPLYVVARTASTVQVHHAQWGQSLGDRDWWLIGHIGLDVAKAERIGVAWGGTIQNRDGLIQSLIGEHPSMWEIDCQDGCSD